MRKIIFIISFICLGMVLLAQTSEATPEPETPVVKFALLSAPVYNLDMQLSAEMQRVYVTTDFTIEKAMLPQAEYYTFLLSKNAKIEQVYVNKKLTAPIITTKLVPQHFNPVFPDSTLLADDAGIVCYSFNLASSVVKEETVHFQVKYWIPLPEWQLNAEGCKFACFKADQFWYPRNIVGSSIVKGKLVTSERYSLNMGTTCPCTDADGIRTHSSTFTDSPGSNPVLTIIKS